LKIPLIAFELSYLARFQFLRSATRLYRFRRSIFTFFSRSTETTA